MAELFLLYAGFIIRVDISSSDDELDGILYISFCIGLCVFSLFVFAEAALVVHETALGLHRSCTKMRRATLLPNG